MNNYTQPLTKKDFLKLQQANSAVTILKIYPNGYQDEGDIGCLHECLFKQSYQFFCTREDYAMYVKGVQKLPEGYTYANKPFGQGIYDGLFFYRLDNINKWSSGVYRFKDRENAEGHNYWQYCFSIEDLARVETPKTMKNISHQEAVWLQKHYPETLVNVDQSKHTTENIAIKEVAIIGMVERQPYQELMKVYVTQETKDLIEREMPLATLNEKGEPTLNPNNEHFEEVADRFKPTTEQDKAAFEEMANLLASFYKEDRSFNLLLEKKEGETSLLDKLKEISLQARLKPTREELETQIENLQAALILQKSKTKVLIQYYKERNSLDQAISKLEEELTNG
jgi:hypothetical protein